MCMPNKSDVYCNRIEGKEIETWWKELRSPAHKTRSRYEEYKEQLKTLVIYILHYIYVSFCVIIGTFVTVRYNKFLLKILRYQSKYKTFNLITVQIRNLIPDQ